MKCPLSVQEKTAQEQEKGDTACEGQSLFLKALLLQASTSLELFHLFALPFPAHLPLLFPASASTFHRVTLRKLFSGFLPKPPLCFN